MFCLINSSLNISLRILTLYARVWQVFCFFFKDLGHFETHKNSVPYSLLLVFILFDFIQTFKCMGGYMSIC